MTCGTKSVLITGIHGFTGRYLKVELKDRGYQVFGTGTSAVPGTHYFQLDLADRQGIKRVLADVQPDYIIHLAAVAFVGRDDANAFYQVNLVGTRNLLEAIADSSKTPECVLIASSANIYGNAQVEPIDELILPKPANDYAVSKLAMEHMARLWTDKLPLVLVRPFNYTGVGQSVNFLLPKIVHHFQRGAREIELGNLDVARDFSDVRMVVNAYRRLLEIAPGGDIFNLCSGRAYTLQEVLIMMAEIAGYEIAVKVNPALVREHEIKRLCGSNARLVNVIGALESIPLKQTLHWMYNHDIKQ